MISMSGASSQRTGLLNVPVCVLELGVVEVDEVDLTLVLEVGVDDPGTH